MTDPRHDRQSTDTETSRPVGDPHSAGGEHVPTEEARQAEVVLDTKPKRYLVAGIFLAGVVALAAVVAAYA